MAIVATYNGYTFPNIFGTFFFNEDYDFATVRFNFLINTGTAQNLVSECNAMETAVRQPLNNFELKFDSFTSYTFSHTGNTGMLSFPKITKLENDLSTETSRAYQFEFTGRLPADKPGFNFRRNASFHISFEANARRTIAINCEYTASPAPVKSSYENYNLHFPTFVTTILTLVGGTYEKITEHIHTEHEQKITTATKTYREILENETQVAENNAAIQMASCDYSINFGTIYGLGITYIPGDVIPYTHITLNYSCFIDNTQIPDPVNVEALYQGTIKPYIVSRSMQILKTGDYAYAGNQYIVEDENFRFNPYDYKVTGNLKMMLPKTMTSILEYKETIEQIWDAGLVYHKLWDKASDTYAFWQLGSTLLAKRNISIAVLTEFSGEIPELGGHWKRLRHSISEEKREIGAVHNPGNSPSEVTQNPLHIVNISELYLFMVEGTVVVPPQRIISPSSNIFDTADNVSSQKSKSQNKSEPITPIPEASAKAWR